MALQDIGKRRSSKYSVALDAKQQSISQGDMVQVIEGTHNGKQASIKQLFRTFLFLHSNQHVDNSGILVVKARSVSILDGKPQPKVVFELLLPLPRVCAPSHLHAEQCPAL